MVHSDAAALDAVFSALSDATRRDVLERLGQGGGLTVSELAQPHGMSLTGFMKHLRVLEQAGLVSRTKEGRIVRCELSPAPMQEAAVWLSRYEKFWSGRLDALARLLYHQEQTGAPRSASGGGSTPPPPRSGGPGAGRRR
ncbi:ArsR/SmtB family transcription factor [Variovorax saccharolyticus]|uniref:ArsR/SmtB family transcription factor n=1 Tax=Variovorax saccharolyticus TaxID=3053516 RepID=UPI0025753674|nr:helix-turn-helix transcriptional regulator [Variovorax sp. J22R187]MDM0016458.1 helix-turn-helix transcriptional regulator [Variovorax sp. J22R187]